MVSPQTRTFDRRAIALIALLLPAVALAQSTPRGTSTALAHSIYGTPDPALSMPMSLVAPVFLQTDQIDSSITVVNGVISPVQGTVTLRNQAGEVIGRQTLTFPAHSSTPLTMKTLLAAAGSQAHSGSVTLLQDSAMKGPALLAQLSMTLHMGSQAAFLEEELGMPTPHGSAMLEGVASQTRNLPLIAITSVSDVAQTITASCLDVNTKASTIELPAYGTAVVQACSWQAVADGSLSLSSSLLNGHGTTDADYAISLKTDSVPGAFYAFGFALNGGLDQGQLQPLDFYDPGTLASTSIVYVGVPVGAGSLLAAPFSDPLLTLANFSSQPRTTTVTVSDSSSGSPKVQTVARLLLPPFSTQTSTLSQGAGSGIMNTFVITSNGQPGEVQAHLFTRVGSSTQRTEMLAKDARDAHNGGNHPWSTANGDTSTLLLYNPTAQPQQFQVRVSGSGSSWLQLFKLMPFETKAISVNEIISNNTPDHKGKTLPVDLTAGEIQWSTDFGATGLGRILITNRQSALARNYSCATYYNLCYATFGSDNYENLVLDGADTNFESINPVFCTEYSPTSCTEASETGETESFTTQWQYSSGMVQMVSSTNTYLELQGSTLGQFGISGQAEAGSCASSPMSGGGSVVPSLSLNTPLWFFGAGNTPPASFTLGSTQATLMANGASGGTYNWSITTGTNEVSFSPSTLSSSISTTTNSVTIYSMGASSTTTDVTAQLSWASPSSGTLSSTTTFGVDSPYKLVSAGTTANYAVSLCYTFGTGSPTQGNNGWQSDVYYNAVSMFQKIISNVYVNESFGGVTDGYKGENWPKSTASATLIPTSGLFYDTLCIETSPGSPALTPPVKVPQSPLTSNLIFTRAQSWYIGSQSPGVGVYVHPDTQYYYQDHGVAQ